MSTEPVIPYMDKPVTLASICESIGVGSTFLLHECTKRNLLAAAYCPELRAYLILMPSSIEKALRIHRQKEERYSEELELRRVNQCLSKGHSPIQPQDLIQVEKCFLIEDINSFPLKRNIIQAQFHFGDPPFRIDGSRDCFESHEGGLKIGAESIYLDLDRVRTLGHFGFRIERNSFCFYLGSARYVFEDSKDIFRCLVELHDQTAADPNLYLSKGNFSSGIRESYAEESVTKWFRSIEKEDFAEKFLAKIGKGKGTRYRFKYHDKSVQ